MSAGVDRRRLLGIAAGCLVGGGAAGSEPYFDPAQIYAGRPERFPVGPVDLNRINPAFYRTRVREQFPHPPGTLVVDPRQRYLYHLRGGREATRFGVGVGRQGFSWSGAAVIRYKREWPDWYPPEEMIDRQPELERQLRQLRGGWGVPGGPRNPLGARALYLWQGNRDTLYRIHGTPEPWTIGRSVSSGCIRMVNQDIIDLFDEVPVGTTVVVLR